MSFLTNIADALTGKNRQQEADLYQRFVDKSNQTLAAGVSPDVIPINPTDKQAYNFIGESPPQPQGLGGILNNIKNSIGSAFQSNKIMNPISSYASEPVTLDSIQKFISLTPTVTPTPSPMITSFPNQDYVENTVLPSTRKVGLPDSLVAGQWGAEGRFVNPKNNNLFNLMFNGSVHDYQSLENGISDYILTVKNILKGKGYDISKMKDEDIIKGLQEGNTRFEGHKSNPQEYTDLVTGTPEWKFYHK